MKERLLGAAILVAIVVLVVPALLTGPRDTAVEEAPAPGLRSVEIELAGGAGEPEAPPSDPAVETTAPPSPALPAVPAPATGGTPDAEGEALPAEAPVLAGTPPGPGAPDAAPARPAVSAESGWAVQVAALSRADAARDLAARLKQRGYPAFVMEYRADGKVFYRVRVGPEITRENAGVLAERLAKDGQKGVVVSHP